MKKWYLLVLFIYALTGVAQGYKHFTIEQGLPSNRVYKILQDYDGFIWVATDKGLSKFDGEYFKNFTIKEGLPSNDIWEIIITKDNKIWFFTRSNKIGYIKNDSVYSFNARHDEFMYPIVINTDLKKVVFRSYNAIYELKNKQWHTLPDYQVAARNVHFKLLHPEIDYLNVTSQDKSTDSIIYQFRNISKPVKKTFKFKEQAQIAGQINDSLFVLKIDNGFRIINLNDLNQHRFVNPGLFKDNVFIRILATDQDIQISSEHFWAELGSGYQLKNKHFFPKKLQISTLFRDRQGNFWGTTFAKGIYFFPKSSLTSKSYLPDQPVQFIKLMHGQLFAAVLNNGIYKFNKSKDRFEVFYKKKDYFFDMLYNDEGYFGIFANTATIVKKDGKEQTYSRIGKEILALDNGHYAIREINIISIFDNQLKLVKTYPLEGANVLLQHQKSIIAGTPVGLFQLKNDSIISIKMPEHKTLPILSLNKTGNFLIIGTDGYGAYIWQDAKHGDGSMTFIPETKKLIINHIFVDNKHVWMATQKGVLRFTIDKGGLTFDRVLRKTDGLISDHINHVVVYNNRIFTSNFSGIKSVGENQTAPLDLPKIYFKTIKYNNRELNANNPKVKYQKNSNLWFDFGLIDYAGQEHNHYYYKLLPTQNNWVEINSKNVNFNSLSPKNYNFKVKVVNPYRQESIKSFSFAILPLWWQTTWAKFFFVFIFLSLIFLIGYYTRRKELNKQRAKLLAQKQMAEFELHALRSQMNPHFVFNSLNAIQYYINDENFSKSEAYLVKFSRLIRMIFEFSRKKTITLKQEISLLQSYLNLEKMRFGDRFEFCIKIDPKLNISQMEIPTLLLQPIVENAVNHGIFHKKNKGIICLDFKYLSPDSYEVTISDDGVGIEKSKQINKNSLKKHQSRSTQILQDRIKLLNLSGKWQIEYLFTDATNDSKNPYNTIVKLKITKL